MPTAKRTRRVAEPYRQRNVSLFPHGAQGQTMDSTCINGQPSKGIFQGSYGLDYGSPIAFTYGVLTCYFSLCVARFVAWNRLKERQVGDELRKCAAALKRTQINSPSLLAG